MDPPLLRSIIRYFTGGRIAGGVKSSRFAYILRVSGSWAQQHYYRHTFSEVPLNIGFIIGAPFGLRLLIGAWRCLERCMDTLFTDRERFNPRSK